MTTDIKRWLTEQFTRIDSVRSAKVAGSDLIAIHTWSGVVIHVYVVDAPVKVRAIKRIVSENTRVGVGTMFIVNAELVPDDGTQVEPDEGLLALHALFKDKLYTYYTDEGTPHVGQVHFKTFNRGDTREIWYGPDVMIQHLPAYRVWVTAPQSIKGNWLIANFGSEAFWKQADYSAERDAFRQKRRRAAGSPRFYEWSSNPLWSSDGTGGVVSPIPRLPETELERSFRQLGLPRTASNEDVKSAFRRLAREVHPDVSELPKAEAEANFKKLYDAYTFIKAVKGW